MTKCTHKQLMTACMLAGTLMLGACTSTPPVTKEVSIVPITNHLEETNGAFVLKSNTSIGVIDAELIPAAEYLNLKKLLKVQTGPYRPLTFKMPPALNGEASCWTYPAISTQ